MSASRSIEGDITELAAIAEPVDPRQPERRIEIPRATRSFSFQLDNDLTKLVRLDREGPLLRIAVTYLTDTVLERDGAAIPLDGHPVISTDPLGIVIEWRQPLVAWLSWPRFRRRRRF